MLHINISTVLRTEILLYLPIQEGTCPALQMLNTEGVPKFDRLLGSADCVVAFYD